MNKLNSVHDLQSNRLQYLQQKEQTTEEKSNKESNSSNHNSKCINCNMYCKGLVVQHSHFQCGKRCGSCHCSKSAAPDRHCATRPIY